MGLLVWLPLNGNLNNYGTSNVTVTNNGATVNDSGKIGKCYYFAGSPQRIQISKPTNLTTIKNTSIAMWVKSSGSVIACGGISQDSNYTITGFTLYTSGWQFCNGSTYKYLSSGLTANEGVWHHVVCTIDDTNITTYKDGIKVTSSTISALGALTDLSSSHFLELGADFPGGNEYYIGYINDFRVYDHCLSPKEVHDISLGLILHYTLDDEYSEGTTNIASSLNPQSNVGGWGKITATKIDTNYYHIKHYYGSSSNPSYWSTFVYTLPSSYANKIITFSARLKNINYHDINTTSWIFFGQGNNGTYPTHGSVTYYINQLYENMKLVWTGTLNNTNNYLVFEIWSNDLNTNGTIELDLYDIQIEEKDHVTGYVNGTRTSTTIYDCSGYQNHGNITGNLSINSDTPRYKYSTLFSSTTSNYIRVPYQGLQGSYLNKVLTICFWINAQQQGNRHMITGMVSNYNTNIELSTSNGLRIYWAGTPDWSPGITCTLNTWIHIAVVITSTYIKAYKNGVLIGTNNTAPNWGGCTTDFLIASDQRIGTYFLGAKLSDFRLYSTVLSDKDIRELYDKAVTIDNLGNLHSYEIDEEVIEKQQILKSGLVISNHFIEDNENFKVLNDGSVFLRILHHNNPASNLFTINNCWLFKNDNLYSNCIILKNSDWITSFTEFEFLVCEKLESSSTENQFRWKQTSNPALSSTVSGYSSISGSPSYSGGLMNKGTYGCFHNGNTWWCCCGSYSSYSGGIPGFWGVVKSGYLDLYIKIPDNILFGNLADFVKFFKKSIKGNNMIEV